MCEENPEGYDRRTRSAQGQRLHMQSINHSIGIGRFLNFKFLIALLLRIMVCLSTYITSICMCVQCICVRKQEMVEEEKIGEWLLLQRACACK